MKTKKCSRKPSNPAKLWKRLVLAAQAGNKLAIKLLCKAFKPLIRKEAYSPAIIQVLGEDAENTAWEIFLEIIMNYHKTSFLQLPGFIKTNLRHELSHRAFRRISVCDYSSLEEQKELTGKDAVAADNKLFLESIENKSLVDYFLSQLTEKQRLVIQAVYFEDSSIMQFHRQNGISYKVAFAHHQAALKKMHKLLHSLKS